ncbi:MAG: FimV/HubP family polar landmark protein [Pseudomonas sp.]|nr:FimV/HubP family polar landmark protein [Pseudomonas sp.]
MLQVRKLVLAVAAATAFSSNLTYALGLGDLSVKSSLNQPLEAEISLLEVRDLTSVEIKSQLASPEDFGRAGVGREFFLTGLKFTPVLNAKGKSVIRVTSANPVKEPYLNFLVEVLWPNGRLLREYTILLDPPLYSPQKIIYAPQPASIASNRPAPSMQQPVRKPQAIAPVQAASNETAARSTSALPGADYKVQKNDTLWDIAARVGGSSAVHQTMLAIQDLNPNAFIDGNINRMKSGQVLRLPTEQDISSRSLVDAIAQVAQQNSSWKAGRETKADTARQLDATHRSEAGAAPAQVEKTDNLRLVADAPGQAQQAADQGSADNTQSLQDQLALTKERLDSSLLENQDLKSNVEDLSSQLEKLERLIALKDNQLAQLQNAVAEDAPVDASAAAVESMSGSEQSITTEVGTVLADAEPVNETVVELEQVEADVTAIEPQAIVEPVPAVDQTTAEAPAEAVSTPVAAQPLQEEQSLLDKVMADPMLLAAAGGGTLLALLVLLMAVSRRNARKEAELYDEQMDPSAPSGDAQQTDLGHQDAINTDFLSDSNLSKTQEINDASFADDFDFETAPTESSFKEQAVDPIAEANSYISFGRFNQAAEVLSKAVDQEPQRVDLRLKLAEVFADLEDRDGFSRQIQDITEIGGATSAIAQIKARYPQMFDAEQVANVADSQDFDDFNLDDLTLDLPAEVAEKGSSITTELDDLSALLAETESDIKTADSEFNLDVDLDLQTDSHAALSAEADGLESADLDDFNFELDSVLTDEKPATTESTGFADLSLTELDLPTTQSLDAADFELDDDFSLAETESDSQLDSDFGAQLDEVNAELDNLTLSLSDDALALNIAAQTPQADTLLASTDEQTSTVDEPMTDLDNLQDLDGLDDDFGILAGTDETATKLDLARAYVDMGDAEGARDILDEVIAEGNPTQQEQARELIAELG